MEKNNILITGANSPVTIDIIKKLKLKDYLIYATSRRKIKKNKKLSGIKYFTIDLKKNFVLPYKKFRYLIHFASATPYKIYSKKEYNKINVEGFHRLLSQLDSVQKIILLSTTDVLDLNSKKGENKLKRDGKLIYSKSKKNMEKLLIDYSKKYKIKSLILRCPAIMCNTKNNINFIQKLVYNYIKIKNLTIYNSESKFNNIIDTNSIYKTISFFLKKKVLKNSTYTFTLAARNKIKLELFFDLLFKRKKLKFNIIKKNDKYKTVKPLRVSKRIFNKVKTPSIIEIINKI